MKMYTLWPLLKFIAHQRGIQHIRKLQYFVGLCDAYFRYGGMGFGRTETLKVLSTRLDRPESGMVGKALMGIKTADGKHNFKTCLHFLVFLLSSLNGILPTLSALHAIHSFRIQFALMGI